MATNTNNVKKISMNISRTTVYVKSNPHLPSIFITLLMSFMFIHSVLMTHNISVEPNLAFALHWVRTGAREGRSKGRRSCYQSVAPGPKTDRTETAVQHRDRQSPKTNFPQTHWIILASSAAKGHHDSPDRFFLTQFIFLPFLYF